MIATGPAALGTTRSLIPESEAGIDRPLTPATLGLLSFVYAMFLGRTLPLVDPLCSCFLQTALLDIAGHQSLLYGSGIGLYSRSASMVDYGVE
jgi:hypothetical protein